MTSNKEAAYYAAVERAFRSDASKAKEYRDVLYEPDDPHYQKCAAEVLAALNALPVSATVDKNTFAFMLGIGPSALGKCDMPSPSKDNSKIVVDPGGTTRTVKGPLEWTVKKVIAFRESRKKSKDEAGDTQSRKAVERTAKKKQAAVARKHAGTGLLEKIDKLRKSDASPEVRDILKLMANMIVSNDNRILGFVDLHSLTRDELTSAFRVGARIERMTLREALIVRTWVSSAERMPWLAGYRGLFDQATHREKELIANREGERLGEAVDGASDPSADVRATDRNERNTRF